MIEEADDVEFGAREHIPYISIPFIPNCSTHTAEAGFGMVQSQPHIQVQLGCDVLDEAAIVYCC